MRQKNVFLTGAPASFPGVEGRVHGAIQEVLEPGAKISVRKAKDPVLDAWNGMSRFSLSPEFDNYAITRSFYDENGPERIIRWWGGNWV